MDEIELLPLTNENGEVYKEQGPFANGGNKGISPSTVLRPLYVATYGIGDNKIGMQQGKDFETAAYIIMTGGTFQEAMPYVLKGPTIKKRGLKFLKGLLAQKKFTGTPDHNTIAGRYFGEHFLACECDFEFGNSIGELKKSNELKGQKEKYLELIFEMQCYIQGYCFQKQIYLVRVYETGKDKEVKITKTKFVPKKYHEDILKLLLGNMQIAKNYNVQESIDFSESLLYVKDICYKEHGAIKYVGTKDSDN